MLLQRIGNTMVLQIEQTYFTDTRGGKDKLLHSNRFVESSDLYKEWTQSINANIFFHKHDNRT